ncbi:hypothetical protein [Sinorhizobium meliloti]|uniref:hypothetical protein n=1 Tax=Rhizobium meliloti TaxID=382 RepID=UPI000FD8D17A|nr:hypothetical protein [Sinorhizobium meliloti]RVH21429.1 hypothetical protein CN216_00205 [Sinorhizobium meliloti]RVH21490.1 hypothetical protein CN216_00525 [Sinorhizobium meliloti]
MKAITWSTVAIAAAVITAAIFVFALSRREELRFGSFLWVYAGSFAALAVTWGLAEILLGDGYGTGDIF